uniref:Cell adhesion molecule L1-like b n=1 Tax=Neogobius melanostomus TaxID=47308 RepID=A0A8C6U7I6_9GOBI
MLQTAFNMSILSLFCRFAWTKNGQEFDPLQDPRLMKEENSGTFVIPNNGNLTEYQGTYRCYATNKLGTAISTEIEFIVPHVPKFPKETIEPLKVDEGLPFVLKCNPPKGIPPLQIYWMTINLQHIEQDERVSMGLNGDLYFAHAEEKDSRRDYCCFAAFPRIRTIVQKTAMSVIIQTSIRPSLLTPPGVKSEIALVKGEDLNLECIAEDCNPTPQVEWFKIGDELPEKVTVENHGKLLVVSRAEQEDSGKYMCKAKNELGEAVHYFTVIVEEPPEWLFEPESQLSMVGSDVILKCSASGTPQPTVTWRVNGLPLSESPLPNRRILGDTIALHNAKESDSAVYQCEVSNKHGSMLVNANIMIMNLPPMIMTNEGENYSAVEAKGVIMHCNVFSSPPSTITWSRDDSTESVQGPRFTVHDNGSLEIYETDKDDAGQYTCYAKNIEGSSAIEAMLYVKGTVFLCIMLKHCVSIPSTTSQLSCLAEYDKSFSNDFELLWEKDDMEIGGRPDCLLLSTEFIIQFEESQWEPGNWKELLRVPGNLHSTLLKLHGHVDYRFRVAGVNAVGRGPYSEPTERYKTEPAAPDRNPETIKIEGYLPHEMDINWEPLLPIEHNGPGLEYKVSYRRQDMEEDWHEHMVKRHSFVVKSTPTFVQYEIKIQAKNHQGWGPEPKIVTGYSGEDFPSAAPDNVAVKVMNGSVVKVSWAPVHKEKLHGHLGGYRINWWRLRSLVDSKKQHGDKHALNVPGDRTHATVPNLTPFSEYSLIVMTFNGRGNGPAHGVYRFTTSEGGKKNPVFRVTDVQKHSVSLAWAPPLEPNGILTRYLLEYQLINDTEEVGPLQTVDISNPHTTKWLLRDLEAVSKYKFYLRSCTTVGCGPVVSEESTTTLEASEGEWKISDTINSSELFHVIDGLQPGTEYTVRLLPNNTLNSFSIFEENITTTGEKGISTQGWFIGLMCAIALLTLIVLVACFVNRNRGGKYSVKEKEDLHPDVESQGMNDDTFCEYSDNDEKPLKGSQHSLSGDMKAGDSGDSLVDYGDEDVQFNEDGSFIGEYAGRKEKRVSAEVKSTAQTPA